MSLVAAAVTGTLTGLVARYTFHGLPQKALKNAPQTSEIGEKNGAKNQR